jgi:hypothetical protein
MPGAVNLLLFKKGRKREKTIVSVTDWLTVVVCGVRTMSSVNLKILLHMYKVQLLLTLCLSVWRCRWRERIHFCCCCFTWYFFFQGGITTSVARQREWTTRLSRYNFAERIRHSTNGRETCGPFKIARHSNSFCSCTHRRFIYLKRTGVYTHNHDRDDAI